MRDTGETRRPRPLANEPSGATRPSEQAFIEEQRSSNRSAIPYFDSFSSHRERLTAAVSNAYRPGTSRLCVLGAGNVHDLDLEHLCALYREVHLVDIDEDALARAHDRQNIRTRGQISLHAPVDLSGLFDKLEAWRGLEVTPEELSAYPQAVANRIADRLPAPFDVVVSACLLTQMQLAMLNALSSSHHLFEAIRQLLNLMHLRTLSKLLVAGGRAILATDVSSNQLAPISDADPRSDLRPLMAKLLAAGEVFYAAHPNLLRWMVDEDPMLRRTVRMSPPFDAWLWKNGAERAFLVYAMELVRIAD